MKINSLLLADCGGWDSAFASEATRPDIVIRLADDECRLAHLAALIEPMGIVSQRQRTA